MLHRSKLSIRAVVYQSVSAKAAASIFGRLKETVKDPLAPSKVVALPPKFIIEAALSNAKGRTIQNLAEWFTPNRRLAKALPTLSDDELVQTLTTIPGIGTWTVNVFLIFTLGRLDVMPAADLGIRRGLQMANGLPAMSTPKQVLERSQAWRPYRSIASIYLWQAAKLKIGPNELNKGAKR